MQSLSVGDFVATARAEAWKWIAAGLMLYEHVWRFALGEFPVHVQLLGRAVFPLFVLALAVQCADASREAVTRTFRRLCVFGIASIACSAMVRDSVPLPVMVTFAAGVGAYLVSTSPFGRWLYVIAIVFAGLILEFGSFGVIAVFAAMSAAREHRKPSRYAMTAVAVGALVLAQVRWDFGAVGVLLAFSIALTPLQLPRMRHAFYWVYIGQWPVIRVMSWLVR